MPSREPGGEDPPGGSPNTFITYLEREYLWGPGDGITGGAGAGLDELIAIFDADRRAWWTLLDASGDVVAIVDDSGTTAHGFGNGATTSPARLCAQFGYDPYGALLAVQELHPFPDPRTGHKGLHLDRLDEGLANPVSGAPIGRHAVGATHAYLVRNRHYSPELGRFMQRDPNGAGGIVVGIASLGSWHPQSASKLSLREQVRDGVGVYGWLRQSPTSGWDPLGLFTLIDAMATATTVAQMFVPGPSDFLEAVARSVVEEYSIRQEHDLFWAEDWDAGDDVHSRLDDSWIVQAIAGGLYDAFEVDIGVINFNILDGFAQRSGPDFSSAARNVGRKAAVRNLELLGLTGARLAGKSHASGRKLLEARGFKFDGRTATGRVEYVHPTRGTRVTYDSGKALDKGQTPHWHIRDRGGDSYDRYGRKVDSSTRQAHIPAR